MTTNLFNSKLLLKKTESYESQVSTSRSNQRLELRAYLASILQRIESKTFGKEESEKAPFLNQLFTHLGYTFAETFYIEESTGGRSADAILGNHIRTPTQSVVVACEIKGIDTRDLERGKAGETPVQQMMNYVSTLGARIGIVSNFVELRIYTYATRQDKCHIFSLKDLVEKQDKLNELYYLLNSQNILGESTAIEQLVSETGEAEKAISKQFYSEFKIVRANLYQHLIAHNPDHQPALLLEKTQKILDRLIFTFFAEDVGLLPQGDGGIKLSEATYKFGLSSRDRSDERVWREFRNLFMDIDEGRSDVTPKIPGYNGGLFKTDPVLDSLHIKDPIWESVIQLAKYDYDSELNVNILGHIFEQSISDIEQLKAELSGEVIDAKKSKRKKDGIYYTPEYITRYIVENTVGKWLEENPGKLEQIKILDPACGSGSMLNQAHSYLLTKYKEREYDPVISTVMKKSLPSSVIANGVKQSTPLSSGWQSRDLASISNIRHPERSMGSTSEMSSSSRMRGSMGDLSDNSTLDFASTDAEDKIKALKSLYGVDLQPESVEISKLSLWLKTADKDHKLTNLDSQIKCGNSLIDDPAVAGDKAFDWYKEFPDILGSKPVIIQSPQGVESMPLSSRAEPRDLASSVIANELKQSLSDTGFDAIIGNPPYVFLRNDNIKNIERNYLRDTYTLYSLKPRTDIYFLESAFSRVKDNGYISFIVPKNILTIGSLSEFRKYLLENFSNITILDIKDKVFLDANVDTIVLSAKKNKADTNIVILSLEQDIITTICEVPVKSFLVDDNIINYEMYINPLKALIIKKIESTSELLSSSVKISNGLVAYKFNNGIPKQSQEIINNRVYHSNIKSDDTWKNYIGGSDSRRYEYNWTGEYIKYGKNLGETRKIELFDNAHLIVRVIPSKAPYCINCAKIEGGVINDQNYIVLYNFTDKTQIGFICAILNSKPISFWFINKLGKMQRALFPQLKAGELANFPIPTTSYEVKQILSDLANNIANLKQVQHKKLVDIQNFIASTYNITIKKSLPEYETLLKDLKSLSIEKQSEFHTWYQSKKSELDVLQQDIQSIDDQIDQEVYRLYGLTDEEIKIIEVK